ncbi:hypothetical protein DXO89_11085 [Xanthomonas oryzae pv. oryzae]|uniref:Uncharacterized protein n=1 Tax=Xanthomonas oryzae pv. oryzae TaxID=64187 RepID=A0A854CPV9_XANOO|nr:hypothetical protein BXO2_06525 [Xanthomonas oryzae pv. oryzae]OLG70887.1 hypothetical protein BXO554_10625 [Xanthomonas oryzae pv. oryzae]OLG72357.1 hypothetical protein BXO416_03605 [Xanthomonas oryzae pv. oryzae]OLG78897.1 hypothetical protein BXO454_02320 [Xanthomonas oryzae pv. oryzae]OLG84247.1 hypothetical protein BXO432_02035 [Xanthomonas oryzae pv. oryzae]
MRPRAHVDALAGAPDIQAVELQLLVLRLIVDGDLPGFLQAFGALHDVTEPAVGLRHAAGQIDLVGYQLLAQPVAPGTLSGTASAPPSWASAPCVAPRWPALGQLPCRQGSTRLQKTPPRRFITSLLINHPLLVKTH